MLHLLLLEQLLFPLSILIIKPRRISQDIPLLFFHFAFGQNKYHSYFFFNTYIEYLLFTKLLLCADIKTNPGTFNRCKSISFYHWNQNGVLARNRVKFHLVQAFVVSNNIDIFCKSVVRE